MDTVLKGELGSIYIGIPEAYFGDVESLEGLGTVALEDVRKGITSCSARRIACGAGQRMLRKEMS